MIINLTQHPASAEQRAAGVVDLEGAARSALQKALTFDSLPTEDGVFARARFIAGLVGGDSILTDGLVAEKAMIGGAMWLMGPLTWALERVGVEAMFAFSERECVETIQSDGAVLKTSVFRHKGFVSGGRNSYR